MSPLFDTDVSGVPLAAVPDFSHLLGSREWEGYRAVYEGKTYVFRDYIEKGLGIGNLDSFPYMNAGILLINLDEWRKSGLGGRVVNFLAEHRLNFPDQDSLNRHIGGNFIRLDARWNAQAPCAKRRARFLPKLSRGKKADWAAIRDLWFRDPWIVHYAGANKPWIASDPATPFDALWWTFAARSPLANKIEKDYLAERQAAGIQKLKIPARWRISLNTDTARA